MLREELQLLQEQGSYVGEVIKPMDKKKVLGNCSKLIQKQLDGSGLGLGSVPKGFGSVPIMGWGQLRIRVRVISRSGLGTVPNWGQGTVQNYGQFHFTVRVSSR